ncbi:MAG TPA: twin-arginine translocase TatA/TatE family subunit [Acidimicrobiales bacterium]
MGTLGPAEILVILVIALIVLGPEKLPDAAKQAGRFIAEVRRIGSGFQAELKDALDTTVNTTSNSATAGSLPPTTPAPGAPPGPSADLAGQVPPAPHVQPQPPPPAHPPATDPSA